MSAEQRFSLMGYCLALVLNVEFSVIFMENWEKQSNHSPPSPEFQLISVPVASSTSTEGLHH